MKNLIVLLVSVYATSGFAVAVRQIVECRPADERRATYTFTTTSGGAPGFPVSLFTVTRAQPGFATVSSTIDMGKSPETRKFGGLAPFAVGSAFLYSRTFSDLPVGGQVATTLGYVSVYVRRSQGVSVIDIQLPADAENAALLNTTPPLMGYVCSHRSE